MQIGAVHQALADKVGQIESLPRDVKRETRMLRVDSSHMQVGKIAHDADGKGNIEASFLSRVMRTSQQCQPVRPARCVVIVGSKALLIGILQYLDHFNGLRRRFAFADPRQRVSGRAVKISELGPVAGEVGPTKLSQVAGSDDRAHPGSYPLWFLCGTGFVALTESRAAEPHECRQKQNG